MNTRLKKNLLASGIFLAFCHPLSSQAVLILTHRDEAGKIQHLSDPVQFNSALETMEFNQWPHVREVLSKEPEKRSAYEGLLKSEKGAEETFVNKKLLEQFKANSTGHSPHNPGVPNAVWVPTILWDLFSVHEAVTDPHYKTSIKPYETASDSQNARDFYRLNVERFIHFIKSAGLEKLLTHPGDSTDYEQLMIKLIEDMKKKAAENKAFVGLFEEDFVKMKKGEPNLVSGALRLEIEAYEKNKTVLWRATSGVHFSSEAQDYEKMVKMIAEVNSGRSLFIRDSFCRDDNLEKGRVKWIESSGGKKVLTSQWNHSPPRKLLDYPLKAGETVDGVLTERIDGRTDGGTMNFSFANSLLGGYIFDGPSRNLSASTYVFARRGKYPYTYGLVLDKEWEISEGKKLFAFVPTPDFAGVIGSQEEFHPRTRLYDPQRFGRNSVMESNLEDFKLDPKEPGYEALRRFIRKKIEKRRQDDLEGYGESRSHLGLEEEVDHELAIQNMAKTMSTLLVDHARIIDIEGRTPTNAKDSAVMEVLEMQRKASRVYEDQILSHSN